MRVLVCACVAAALLGGCADEGTSGPVADIGQIGDDVTSPVDDAGVTPDGASEDGEGDTYIPSEDVTESDTSPGPPPFVT